MEERTAEPPPEPTGPAPLGTGTAPAIRFIAGAIVGGAAGVILSLFGGLLTYAVPHSSPWLSPVLLFGLLLGSLTLLRRRWGGMIVRGVLAGAALALLCGTLCSGCMALGNHPPRIAG